MAKSKVQEALYALLEGHTITYNANLARALGSAKAAILFGQLAYWQGKSQGEWFYKTLEELEEETALTRHEQDKGIAICRQHGIIEIKVASVPARRYFRVNINKVANLLASLRETGNPVCRKPANKNAGKRQTITEITTEITSESSVLQTGSDDIKALLTVFYSTINPGIKFGHKTYRTDARFLIDEYGLEKAIKYAEAAVAVQGKQYAPTIINPSQLREKLPLLAKYIKEKQPQVIQIDE